MLFTHVESNASTVSLLKSYRKAINNNKINKTKRFFFNISKQVRLWGCQDCSVYVLLLLPFLYSVRLPVYFDVSRFR